MGVCPVACAIDNSNQTYHYNEKSIGLYRCPFTQFVQVIVMWKETTIQISKFVPCLQNLGDKPMIPEKELIQLERMLGHPFFSNNGILKKSVLLSLGMVLANGSAKEKTQVVIRLIDEKKTGNVSISSLEEMIVEATVIASIIVPILAVLEAFQDITQESIESIQRWTTCIVNDVKNNKQQLLASQVEQELSGKYAFIYNASDLRAKYRSNWRAEIHPLRP